MVVVRFESAFFAANRAGASGPIMEAIQHLVQLCFAYCVRIVSRLPSQARGADPVQKRFRAAVKRSHG